MASRTLFCKTLLQGGDWRENCLLRFSSDGFIESIDSGRAELAEQRLNGLVVPGMPNAHSHSFQRLIAGLTASCGHQQDSFWSWREAMYRCANQITPQQMAVVSAWVFTSMLKEGYTTCAEFHYVHHQADGQTYDNPAEMSECLVESAVNSGISLTLLPVLYNTAGFGEDSATPMQRRFIHSAEEYLKLLQLCQKTIDKQPLMTVGMAPHSLRAVPGKLLQEVLHGWRQEAAPVHIHIAEQPAEIDSCLQHTGARPVQWLLDNFEVDKHWCLVHATHLSTAELKQAAASGAVAGLCPTTEADLGDGVFRTSQWLQQNGQFAIGSDSNVRISVAEELRQLEYNERLASGQRNVLAEPGSSCGRFLYQHAALAGARACGQPVGELQPGLRADFVELDGQHELIDNRSPDAAMDSWIFAGDNSVINSVWVAGKCLVQQGHHSHEQSFRSGFASVLKEMQTA